MRPPGRIWIKHFTAVTEDGESLRAKRPRVLMSAFACEPGRGSEQEVGWRWAVEMSRWFEVVVITQTRNRPAIRQFLEQGLPRECCLSFEYVQLAGPVYRLKSRFDALTWPYYALWQRVILKRALQMHTEQPFALAHHVTFVSFRVPVWLKLLGIPVVFGPVGGADTAPFQLLGRGFGWKVWCKEVARNFLTRASEALLRLKPPLRAGRGLCLAATPAMRRIFERANLPAEVFPAVGIDSGPEREDRDPGPLRLLFVGRFHPLKGTHLLLEAFARTNLAGATLTLVGEGSERDVLRKLADRLGIADRLTWTGKIPRARLAEQYRSHDLLIAPSLYESGGLVALEAMAEATPVVVLDVGGHSVSVAEGCGIKVPVGGSIDEVIDRLAAALRHFAESPDEMLACGRRAQRRVGEAYEWPRKARRMREIYERLMEQV